MNHNRTGDEAKKLVQKQSKSFFSKKSAPMRRATLMPKTNHESYLAMSKQKIPNYECPLTEHELTFLRDKACTSDDSDHEIRRIKDLQNKQITKKSQQHRKGMFSQTMVVMRKKSGFVKSIKRKWVSCELKIRNFIKRSCKPSVKQSKEQNYIISPDGYPKLCWDLICMMLIFYQIMAIPINISFSVDAPDELDYVMDAFFFTDIAINFTTAYYEHGMQVTDRKKIILKYITLWFWIDLVSTFPYDLVLASAMGGSPSDSQKTAQFANGAKLLRFLKFLRFVKIIRLLRLAKLKVIFDKLEEMLQVSATLGGILSFAKLTVFVLFWGHWLGCIFHFIAQQEDPDNNWLSIFGLADQEWYVRYVNSLYWAVTTMCTVGYGDLSPQTPIERLFGVLLLLIACGVFAFTMNSIGAALQQLDQKKSENRHRLSNVNNYMKKAQIPNDLQCRVRRYLEFIWDSDRSMTLEDLVSNLSNELRLTLLIQVNGNMIGYIDQFCDMFSNPFLLELTLYLQEQTFFPQEYIFREFEENYQEKDIYVVQSGEIEIIFEKTGIVIDKKRKNDCFGEIGFFSGKARSASAKSVSFTNIFYLQRLKFLEALKSFPLDHEKYCQVKDNILLYSDYSGMSTRCYTCQMDDHVARECPHLHFTLSAPHYIRTLATCIRVQQSIFIRKDRLDYNSRYHLKVIQSQVDGFIALHSRRANSSKKEYLEDLGGDDNHTQKSDASVTARVKQLQKNQGKFETSFKKERREVRKSSIDNSVHNKQEGAKASKPSRFQLSNQLIEVLHERDPKKRSTKMVEMLKSSRSSINSPVEQEQQVQANTSDEEEKLENIAFERMNEILQNIQEEKKAKSKKLLWKDFMLINDFEYAADLSEYFPKNNISNVLRSYHMALQRGFHNKPLPVPEINQQELNEYIDYYKIPLGEYELSQFLTKERNANLLDKDDKFKRKLDRRTKKIHNYINTPKAEVEQKLNQKVILSSIKKLKAISLMKAGKRSSSQNQKNGKHMIKPNIIEIQVETPVSMHATNNADEPLLNEEEN